MIFRRSFLAFPIVAGLLALMWIGVAQVHRDWWAGYSTRDITLQPINWPLYYTEIKLKEFWRALRDKGSVGLPQVPLYFPRNSPAALMEDIHDSVNQIYETLVDQEYDETRKSILALNSKLKSINESINHEL